MFVFTLVDNRDMEHIVPFYYRAKRLGLNDVFNFVFNDEEVYRAVKLMRLKTNIHLHAGLSESFLAEVLTKPQPFLFVDVKTILTKNPIPLFQDALCMSDVVYYETKNNHNFFGANYNNNFKFYYPVLMDDYDLYLQKNEGNIYTLPSRSLTTTKN